jgi:hypothetical protein
MSFQPRDLLVVVPGLAAVGLGLLYGTGAVIKSGQLRGSDLSVRDTLPLIPLEQILAVGIGTLVTSLLVVALFGALLWIYLDQRWWLDEADETKMRQMQKRRPRFWKWYSRIFLFVFLPFAFFLQFYTSPFFVAIPVAAAVLLGVAVRRYRSRGRRHVLYVLFAYFLIVIAARAGDAYVSPAPLPVASLHLHGRANPITGALVVKAGDTWYLSLHEGTYRAIPASRVATAVVRSRKREREPRPVLRVVRDEVESWFR